MWNWSRDENEKEKNRKWERPWTDHCYVVLTNSIINSGFCLWGPKIRSFLKNYILNENTENNSSCSSTG